MNIKIKLQKYSQVIKTTSEELTASPENFIGRMIILAFRIILMGVVYSTALSSKKIDQISGLSISEIILSLAIIQAIGQCSRNSFRILKQEITSGQIETKLNKPYSFILYNFLESAGQVPIKLTTSLIVMTATIAMVFSLPSLSSLQILTIVILIVQGIIVNIVLYQSFALTAFWLENPDPIYWIFTKMAWFINGTFIPLALLPQSFRIAADWLPLSAPYFAGRIFEMNTDQQLLKYILIQNFWLIIISFTVHFLYKRGVKKVSINGG